MSTFGPFVILDTDSSVTDPADLPDAGWIPAVVPGGVHESLLAVGRLEHPYRDRHEPDARWVEERVWWYRGQLELDEGASLLEFPVLDTVVEVWLDGVQLASHANAFRPLRLDLSGTAVGPHDIHLRFAPPLEGLEAPAVAQLTVDLMKAFFAEQRELASEDGTTTDASEDEEVPAGVLSGNLAFTRRRKPTYSWGWDFAPRLPSVGVLEAPVLKPLPMDRLIDHAVRTVSVDAGARTAVVALEVEAHLAHAGRGSARIRIHGRGHDSIHQVDLPATGEARRHGTLVVELADVDLWWTHDLGEPALYDVTVDLLLGEESVDSATSRTGLRIVELDRSADDVQPGRLFRFLLNGVPTFARGANLVPMSMMRGSVSPTHARTLVERSAAAQMTMIRVWGGGYYEQDAFYEACDEKGVLVWQDFMFACIDYPSAEVDLQAETLAEADHQIRRLRRHPSVAVWCGNNEVHGIHHAVYGETGPGDWGWHLFHSVLPDAVARLSPGTPYWPGSPYADRGADAVDEGHNGVNDGDRHAWEVWHGMDLGVGGHTTFETPGEAMHFHRYAADTGRFISEFGLHASPELATLRRWTDEELVLGGPALLHRIKDAPKDKGAALIELEAGAPRDIAQYVETSMAVQAEGLKFGIEHYRRRQPHTSGTLVWQLDDPWPGLSWSVLDHDLEPKAGYWFLQRVYHPVLTSFRQTDDGLELWATNSTPEQVEMDLVVDIATFDGVAVISHEVPVQVAGGASQVVWSAPTAFIEPGPDRFAWVSDRSGRTPNNRFFFGRLKDLPLGKGELDVEISGSAETGVRVSLLSRGYSYFTRLTCDRPGLVTDTNYVDLRDGDRAVITTGPLPVGVSPADLRVTTWGSRQHPAH